jgi:FkbM family methyltransferase
VVKLLRMRFENAKTLYRQGGVPAVTRAGVERLFGPVLRLMREDHDKFLKTAAGVIHVGANVGQERELYKRNNLPVIWIEPIPEVFKTLKANLHSYPRQTAFQYLVADQNDIEYAFHVANNAGESSSILDLKLHREIWPEVSFDRTITLRSTTLASLLETERINLCEYDALVLDTQGSELLVLKGAAPLLHMFRFIKTEVADFESYAGGCQLKDLEPFVKEHGFQEISRHRTAGTAESGSYYDIVYERIARSTRTAADFKLESQRRSQN